MTCLRAAAALLLLGCAPPPAGTPGNPLFPGADPDAEVADGKLWLFPTGGGKTLHGWTYDGADWRPGPPLIRLADIRWRPDGAPKHYLWAPDMVAANGRYYLYYSVGPQKPTPSRIGVAVADRIEGPFIDSGRPLLTGGNGFEAIDPMVFADPRSHRSYLLAGGSDGATLRMYELAADLTTIAREVQLDQPPNFTEAPFLHERNGTYYLSYSHGSWQRGDYSVHYATARALVGPWAYKGAILTSTRRYKGPGHHSFFTDPVTGAWSIAYHRWHNASGDGPYTGKRRIAIDRVEYLPNGDIAPVAMTP